MTDIGKAVEKIERGNAWNESDEIVQTEVKRPLDKVVPVRLPAADWAKLRKEARELGIGPTTLARMWILERLRLQSISPQDAFKFFRFLVPSIFRESLLSPLTPRETEILKYVAQGCPSKQIAENIGVSEETVKRCLAEILRKLNVEREHVSRESTRKVARIV